MADAIQDGGDELLTPEEAGRLPEYNRGYSSVRLHLKCEDLPHQRVGRQIVIRKTELLEWLARPETQTMLRRGDRIMAKVNKLGRLAATA